MARKTKEEAQATREGILDAAQVCFHEYGVAGTSLAMIGARAGFTRGAVYWHFKNKAEVLTAMIDRERVPFIERMRRTTSAKRNTPILDLRSGGGAAARGGRRGHGGAHREHQPDRRAV